MKIKCFIRAITVIATMTASIAVYAQEKGDMAVGGNLLLGAGESYTNVGIGGKFQYNILDPLRLEGSLSYFFKNHSRNMWDINANAHYLFHVAEDVTIYPLAGVSIMGVRTQHLSTINGMVVNRGTTANSGLGINIGGGFDYKFSERITGNAEVKYRVGRWNGFLMSIGVTYNL